jgi:hypothetical protein
VTLVPVGVSQVILAAELETAKPWLARHSWGAELADDGLTLEIRTHHPADGGPLLLRGQFDGYRALPPNWIFLDPDTMQANPRAWPAAGPVGDQASIFHSFGVVCAHFSRSGFSEMGGPHPWGGLSNWANVSEGVHANTLAEMLSVFRIHLRHSPSRMG